MHTSLCLLHSKSGARLHATSPSLIQLLQHMPAVEPILSLDQCDALQESKDLHESNDWSKYSSNEMLKPPLPPDIPQIAHPSRDDTDSTNDCSVIPSTSHKSDLVFAPAPVTVMSAPALSTDDLAGLGSKFFEKRSAIVDSVKDVATFKAKSIEFAGVTSVYRTPSPPSAYSLDDFLDKSIRLDLNGSNLAVLQGGLFGGQIAHNRTSEQVGMAGALDNLAEPYERGRLVTLGRASLIDMALELDNFALPPTVEAAALPPPLYLQRDQTERRTTGMESVHFDGTTGAPAVASFPSSVQAPTIGELPTEANSHQYMIQARARPLPRIPPSNPRPNDATSMETNGVVIKDDVSNSSPQPTSNDARNARPSSSPPISPSLPVKSMNHGTASNTKAVLEFVSEIFLQGNASSSAFLILLAILIFALIILVAVLK